METIEFVKDTPVGKLNLILSEVSCEGWNRFVYIKIKINSETFDLQYITDRKRSGVVKGVQILSANTEKILGKAFKQNVIIAFPPEVCNLIEAEVKRQENVEEEIKKAYIEDIKAGRKNIKLRLSEGDILTGYVTSNDEDRKILRELGLIEDVRGWGSLVSLSLTKALGSEFSYSQVEEYLIPQKEAEKKKEQERQEIMNNFIKQAKEVGHPVQINQYAIDCTDPKEECSTDIVTQYIDSNGEITEKIIHTW